MKLWSTGLPPAGHVVEVWYWNAIILATWDGARWKTLDGQAIDGVTHWRER